MSERASQQEKAQDFLKIHHGGRPLVLANAWDVASAMIFVHEGFAAIGTTSAGIAASVGYADGQRMSFEENLEVIERIVRCTDLPVSADFESGYGEELDGLRQRSLALLRAGVVGLNIEDRLSFVDDGLVETERHQEKIKAIREASDEHGIHIVINARTDAYLLGNANEVSLREAIERGNAYVDAGADCVFVPDTGDLDRSDIKNLVSEINAPVNVIAGSTTPCLADLQDLGVARVSLGPRPMRAALSVLKDIAMEINTKGTFELMSKESISYDEINSWFAEKG
jgi:2-methylisocitrate lyase-like PEP mutase family enzyme